ncbi:hypothetical protein [Oceaniglobus roseus]|uniref:hypothetical protein n=1 Tax=Oceaniglobus roseus TaxID=1737570 RepID=UPI000C7ED659|nr:hypothetical protein [Kandeliimicrobium roseum]
MTRRSALPLVLGTVLFTALAILAVAVLRADPVHLSHGLVAMIPLVCASLLLMRACLRGSDV